MRVWLFARNSQVPVPVQGPPDQPEKVELGDGLAVRTTLDPAGASQQLLRNGEHVTSGGWAVTAPPPVPTNPTSIEYPSTTETNLSESIVTVHVPVPVHAPDQPKKRTVAVVWSVVSEIVVP